MNPNWTFFGPNVVSVTQQCLLTIVGELGKIDQL